MNYSYQQWAILAWVLIPSIVTDIRKRQVCLWPIVIGVVAGNINTACNGMPQVYEYLLQFLPGAAILLTAYLTKGCIGKGDGWICIFLGSLLTFGQVLTAIFLGFLTAALLGSVLLIFRRASGKTKLAMVPFLSLGVVLTGFL